MLKPSEFEGKIVVIIPIRDEGKQPLKTYQSLMASKAPGTDLQFFIVDDGSTDGCCKPLHGKPNVTIMNAPEDSGFKRQVGQGIIRSLAVQQNPDARGYYSIDGHCDMPTQYGIERLVMQSERLGCIVMARSTNLAKDHANVGVGCDWAQTMGGEQLTIKGRWMRTGVADHTGLIPVKVLAGACYAWTPYVWETINGTRESYGLYGMFDIDLSVASYFCGLGLYCDNDVEAGHWYRRKRPYAPSGRWRNWAYVECFRSMFRPDIFKRVFEPHARFIQKKLKDPVLLWLINSPRFLAIQAEFETRKKRTDEEVLKWMRIS